VSTPADPASEEPGGDSREAVPPLLRIAAGLVLLEGLLLVVLGVIEVVSLDGDRVTMGVTVTLFFLAFGGLLVVCAWGLNRLRPFARGPVLLTQLIGLGLAWNFRDGSTLPVAIGLVVAAALVLAGLLHPRSIEALERAAERL
jgi:peptidoglycan/LPS O-acetylase OafA/YrhL